MSAAAQQQPMVIDFSQRSDARNLALEIEGEKLWVSRETLALYSPVFQAMFYGDFRESNEQTIPLPGKRLGDIRELLHVLTPPILKPIDSNNVDLLLDLAREYSIDCLKLRCNHFLLKVSRKSAFGSDQHLDILVLACKYDMVDLMEQCIPKVAQLTCENIEQRQDVLPAGVMAALYQAKLSKWKKHSRHDLTGSPAPASARPQYNVVNPSVPVNQSLFGGLIQQSALGGSLSYFCASCNSTFSSTQQRLSCRYCKNTVCDDCARGRPCPKCLEHDDTCECEVEYNKGYLRRGNN